MDTRLRATPGKNRGAPGSARCDVHGILTRVSLRPLDLPVPADLNHRWAAVAGINASRGWDHVTCDGPLRYHDDGGGNWAAMALLPEGRALLFGHDHEYSDTYFGEAAAYFGEPETDLLAGAPAWWGEALTEHHHQQLGEWVGFVYGWEGGSWQRASYERDDGFSALNLPMLSHEATVQDLVSALASQSFGSAGPADPQLVDGLVIAGPAVTVDQLRAVLPASLDAGAGAARAARFRLG